MNSFKNVNVSRLELLTSFNQNESFKLQAAGSIKGRVQINGNLTS